MLKFLNRVWGNIDLKSTVIIALVLMLFFKGKYKIPEPQVVVETHIIEHFHTDTVRSVPIITQQIFPTKIETKYIADTSSMEALKKQYDTLVKNHTVSNISQDTLKVGSVGMVAVRDTVRENKIVGRSWSYNLKEREIITTITIKEPYKPKNQLYYGGEVGSAPSAELGVMLKNKKDNIIKLSAEYFSPWKSFNYKIGYYQKLHL